MPRRLANPRAGRKSFALLGRVGEAHRITVACPGSPCCHRTRMGLLGRGLKARTRTRCVRGLTLSVLGSADRPLAVTLARVRYSRSFAFVVFEPFVVHHGFDDIRVHSRVAGPTELRTDRIAEAGVVDDGSDARE